MIVPSKPQIVALLKRGSQFAGVVVAMSALCVLWAWSRNPSVSTTYLKLLTQMNPFTAIMLLLGGVSLILLQSRQKETWTYRVGLLLAAAITFIGSIRLIEYAFTIQPTFDQWLFATRLNGNCVAIVTAVSAVFSGLALMLIDRDTWVNFPLSQYLSLCVSAVTLLTIVGHLYDVNALIFQHMLYQPMALSTGLTFLLLSLGTLCARPEKGLMQVIASESVGGITARRLLPAAIVVPVVLGFLRLEGERRGWYGIDFSAATFAISTLLISVALIWWVSGSLHRLESDRLSAEQENREARSFLSSVLENIPDMIFIKDAKDLRFVSFNKAGEELLGQSRAGLLGKNDYDFFPHEQADFFVAKDREVLTIGKLLDIAEEPIQTHHGKRFLHTKKIPINGADGKPAYLLGISEDITERKLTEEELFQGKKLQAVGLLAAGVAHQVNNPLTVVLGFAQYMRQHVKPGHPLYEAVDSIEREAQRCRTLIQDLLAFSRKKGTRAVAVEPKTVINSALTLIESQSLIKKVKLVREIPEDLPAFEVDSQQIQEVLINLCLNAFDAMPAGGTLTIRARAIADDPLGERIEIRVKDTGPGISEEIRPRIFEPFFTTKGIGEGTGLGLSLCYGIVKSHHGQIEVQSELGKGTTFIVCLPLHPPQTEPTDIQASAA